MTLAQIIGAILLAIPFVIIFVLIAIEDGWRLTLGIFLGSLAITALICLGSGLLVGWS